MFKPRRYYDSFDSKHNDTVSVMERVLKEYCDMTAPFSFVFNDGSKNYRIHVFITCENKFCVDRESLCHKLYNDDFIDIDNKRHKMVFPFCCCVFAEQMNGSRNSSKAPFFIGRYSFDYDRVFNESGHINNNETIKNDFIEVLKEQIAIDVKQDIKRPVSFISNNDFTDYLTGKKKVLKSHITESWTSSFHDNINLGFHCFYMKVIVYKNYLSRQKEGSDNYLYTTITKEDINKTKEVKFYDVLDEIIKAEEDIYIIKSYASMPDFYFYRHERKFFAAYKDIQFKHIKSIMKYLKKLKVNWELAGYCAYDVSTYEEKYNILNTPKKVKTHYGIIRPRLDFVCFFKSVVQSCSVEYLKTLLPYIDELKPLSRVDIKVFDRVLSPAERKMIAGKPLEQMFDDNKELTRFMFKYMDSKHWIPLENTQYVLSKELGHAAELYALFDTYVDIETFIKAVPKNMGFGEFLFNLCKIYDLDRYKYEFKSPLEGFDVNGKVERLLLERISDEYKTPSVDNVFTENLFSPYSNDKFSVYFKSSLSYEVGKIQKEIDKGLITCVDKEDVKFKSVQVVNYVRKNYFPKFDKSYIEDRIKDIYDALVLFDNRVLKPICAYHSGFYNAYSEYLSEEISHELFRIFVSGSKDMLNVVRMSNVVHKYNDRFVNAGKDPASLNPRNKNLDSLFGSDTDETRESLGLSSYYEWTPGINGIFEITHESDDYIIVPLINNEELIKEGESMKHCVGWGGYSESSMKGNSKIFSIRKKNEDKFERLSTLQLFFNCHSREVEINQNNCYRNTRSEVANIVAKCLVDVINLKEDDIVSWEHIKTEQETRKNFSYSDTVANKAGYMPDNIDAIKEAMKPWLPYLDKKYHDVQAYLELDVVQMRIRSIVSGENT